MTKLFYISRINLLSGRTNVYNLAKTCETLNRQVSFEVELITTDKFQDRAIFFENMGISKPFSISCLGVTYSGSRYSGRSWYELIMLILANIRLSFFLLKHFRRFDVVYFRDESLFLTAVFSKFFLRKRYFFEIHSVLKRFHRQLMNNFAIRYATGVIAISSGLKKFYLRQNPNILVSLCSAAEDSWFDYSRTLNVIRQELKLPQDKFIVGYTGVVGANPNNDYYEIDDVVRSLVILPPSIILVVVGELNNNAEWLRDLGRDLGVEKRIVIIPWQERKEIPKYLQAFDINLIPKRKKDLVGDSPAKMFPALAARRPIIAGRAESIEEVLTDGLDAVVVEQNNPEGWEKAISKIYNDQKLIEKLVAGAKVTKNKYTWEKRGVNIAEFIKKSL